MAPASELDIAVVGVGNFQSCAHIAATIVDVELVNMFFVSGMIEQCVLLALYQSVNCVACVSQDIQRLLVPMQVATMLLRFEKVHIVALMCGLPTAHTQCRLEQGMELDRTHTSVFGAAIQAGEKGVNKFSSMLLLSVGSHALRISHNLS